MNRPRLYIDEDAMGHGLFIALRARHVDVVTATEAKMINKSDEAHLRWATENSRVLYSFNIADYVRLHQTFVEREEVHGGIVHAFSSAPLLGVKIVFSSEPGKSRKNVR